MNFIAYCKSNMLFFDDFLFEIYIEYIYLYVQLFVIKIIFGFLFALCGIFFF